MQGRGKDGEIDSVEVKIMRCAGREISKYGDKQIKVEGEEVSKKGVEVKIMQC